MLLSITSQMVLQLMSTNAQKPPSFQQTTVAGTEEFSD